jgi:hypothetical protein
VSSLPPGTAAGWLATWARASHCSEWEGLWANVFSRLAHPDVIEDGGGEAAEPGGGDALRWGEHLPFFFSRLALALRLPVPGGSPQRPDFPEAAKELLGGSLGIAPSFLL